MQGKRTEAISRYLLMWQLFKEDSMKGWQYRLGIAIKNMGERLRLSWLVRIGLKIKDKALI